MLIGNEQEMKRVVELVVPGNYMLNHHRENGQKRTEYDDLTQKLLAAYLSAHDVGDGFSAREKLSDRILADCEDFIEEYNRQAMPYTVAEIVAERKIEKMPQTADCDGNLAKLFAVQELPEDEITKKGEGIISIDMPDFEEKFKAYWDKCTYEQE